MGCGCSKIRYYTPEKPLVIGENDGSLDPVYARNTVTIMGLKTGSEFWAVGAGVDPLVQAGWLTLI